MAKKYNIKISKFENATIVKLKSNNRQVRLLSRYDNRDSVYISWNAKYYEDCEFDEDFVVREDELYS